MYGSSREDSDGLKIPKTSTRQGDGQKLPKSFFFDGMWKYESLGGRVQTFVRRAHTST